MCPSVHRRAVKVLTLNHWAPLCRKFQKFRENKISLNFPFDCGQARLSPPPMARLRPYPRPARFIFARKSLFLGQMLYVKFYSKTTTSDQWRVYKLGAPS